MLDKKILIWEILGLIFCVAFAFVFHFAFDWLGKPTYLAWLFAVNESVWEHSKIIFYPYLFFSCVEFFAIKHDVKIFFTAKALPLIFSVPIMIAIYYTYTGVIGNDIAWLNIAITIGLFLVMFIFSFKMLDNGYYVKYYLLFICLVIVITLCLIIFTYLPPKISLFFDVLYDKYGI